MVDGREGARGDLAVGRRVVGAAEVSEMGHSHASERTDKMGWRARGRVRRAAAVTHAMRHGTRRRAAREREHAGEDEM